MEIPLSSEIEQVVARLVESGKYPSLEVLVEEALFLLVERDWNQSQADLQDRWPAINALDPTNSPGGDTP